jgi:hypothetical protein
MLVRRWLAKIFGWAQMFSRAFHIKIESSAEMTTTMTLTLASAGQYYSRILKPTYDEFFAKPATLRSAFILASALFHFHEWLFEYHEPALDAHFGIKLGSKYALWREVGKAGRKIRLHS